MSDLAFVRWLQSTDPTPPELPSGPLADIAPLIASLRGEARIAACHEELDKLDGPGKEAWRRLGAAMKELDAPSTDPTQRKTAWTFDELLTTEFPEPEWVIPGILPVGLVFLSGRPKVGKSWLALQIANAVSCGGRVFGETVQRRRVLYLALEDSPARLKNRLLKQRAELGADAIAVTAWPAFGQEGGMVVLEEQIKARGYGLVIIDTLSRAAGMADQMDIAQMTGLLGPLQRIAQVHNMTVLVVDHHRKSSGFAENPIDDIMGSTAKSAICDAALGLYKQQGKRGATLMLTGRDLEEKDLALDWDPELGSWLLLGEAGTVKKESLKLIVVATIRDLAKLGELPTTTNLAQHLDEHKGTISRTLTELLDAGEVVRGKRTGRQQPYYTPDTLPLEQS